MKYKNHLIFLIIVVLVASTFGVISFFGTRIKRTWATTGQMFGYYCDLLGNPGSCFKEMGHGYVDQLQSVPTGDKLFVSRIDKSSQNDPFGALRDMYFTRGSWQEPITIDENVKDAKPYILLIALIC
jgi:hypothetical protein